MRRAGLDKTGKAKNRLLKALWGMGKPSGFAWIHPKGQSTGERVLPKNRSEALSKLVPGSSVTWHRWHHPLRLPCCAWLEAGTAPGAGQLLGKQQEAVPLAGACTASREKQGKRSLSYECTGGVEGREHPKEGRDGGRGR